MVKRFQLATRGISRNTFLVNRSCYLMTQCYYYNKAFISEKCILTRSAYFCIIKLFAKKVWSGEAHDSLKPSNKCIKKINTKELPFFLLNKPRVYVPMHYVYFEYVIPEALCEL